MDDARSLIVHRWRSFFLQNAEISSNFAVWLHISKLPIELYNSYFLLVYVWNWICPSPWFLILKSMVITSILNMRASTKFVSHVVAMGIRQSTVLRLRVQSSKVNVLCLRGSLRREKRWSSLPKKSRPPRSSLLWSLLPHRKPPWRW